jgi:hypothetical protein
MCGNMFIVRRKSLHMHTRTNSAVRLQSSGINVIAKLVRRSMQLGMQFDDVPPWQRMCRF